MEALILSIPNRSLSFQLDVFKKFSFEINAKNSIKKRLPHAEFVTNEQALKVLKYIKIKSDVMSFLTKPIVFISLGALVLVTGAYCAALSTHCFALGILGVPLASIGGGLIGFGFENGILRKWLVELSKAYANQSKIAADLIAQITTENDFQIVKFK